MSRKSKFEGQLSPGLRKIGFCIKIPDAGIGYKPFDYVVGLPRPDGRVEFIAIEAKKANGWTLGKSKWQAHQRKALDAISSLSMRSAWVAIGFLDIPKMKLDHNRKRILDSRPMEAYLVPWNMFKKMEGDVSLEYSKVLSCPGYALVLTSNKGRRIWTVPESHPLVSQKIKADCV